MKKDKIFTLGALVALMAVALIIAIAVGLGGFRGEAGYPKSRKFTPRIGGLAVTQETPGHVSVRQLLSDADQRHVNVLALTNAVRSPGEHHPFIHLAVDEDGGVRAVFIIGSVRHTVDVDWRGATGVRVWTRPNGTASPEPHANWAWDRDSDGLVDLAVVDGEWYFAERVVDGYPAKNPDLRPAAQGLLDQVGDDLWRRTMEVRFPEGYP